MQVVPYVSPAPPPPPPPSRTNWTRLVRWCRTSRRGTTTGGCAARVGRRWRGRRARSTSRRGSRCSACCAARRGVRGARRCSPWSTPSTSGTRAPRHPPDAPRRAPAGGRVTRAGAGQVEPSQEFSDTFVHLTADFKAPAPPLEPFSPAAPRPAPPRRAPPRPAPPNRAAPLEPSPLCQPSRERPRVVRRRGGGAQAGSMSRGRADAGATPLWHWGELGCGAGDKRAAWDAAAAREREVAVLARRHWNATVRAHYRPPPVAARTIPARRLGVPAAPSASPWSPSKGSKGMSPRARVSRGCWRLPLEPLPPG
jgi:hypothetical protein